MRPQKPNVFCKNENIILKGDEDADRGGVSTKALLYVISAGYTGPSEEIGSLSLKFVEKFSIIPKVTRTNPYRMVDLRRPNEMEVRASDDRKAARTSVLFQGGSSFSLVGIRPSEDLYD